MWNLASPAVFLTLVKRTLPTLALITIALFVVGLGMAFAGAPGLPAGRDRQDHVSPRACRVVVDLRLRRDGARRLGTLVWRHPLADAAQKAAAPLGAGFTFICLVTGSLWGKPMWGTYWVWDARLTSVLVLFILYLGLIALWRAIDDPGPGRARRRDPDAGRRRQPADHQVLRRLVEHAASARFGVPPGRADDRARAAVAAARDGARLHLPVPDACT